MKATAVTFAGFEPKRTSVDYSGKKWLFASYTGCPVDPWQWPAHVLYDGQLYRRLSWNSDNKEVAYKEDEAPTMATTA